jgi:hypothetical protein
VAADVARRAAVEKNRVYEVARRLGVPAREVQRAIDDLGYFVRSAATPMTEEEVQAVVAKLRAESRLQDDGAESDTNG